jgi:hypothetical protein
MLKYRKLAILLAVVLAVSITTITTSAQGTGNYINGLLEMTDEMWEEFYSLATEVGEVKLNALAVERIQEASPGIYDDLDAQIVGFGEEIIGVDDMTVTPSYFSGGGTETIEFPAVVDNSENDAFPPIQDQDGTGSCGPWANAYYQYTNNTALVRGLNAKSGEDADKYRMSTRWVYNLLNGAEEDRATSAYDVAQILLNYGCATWYDCEGTTLTNETVKTWNPGAEIWENALANKAETFYYMNSFIEDMKAVLLNGYVLSVSTEFGTWQTMTSLAAPAGEVICTSVLADFNQQLSEHAMTVVGYNDNIWVDINGNGIEETEEKGAFKIANSWGINYANSGFVWLSYDAVSQYSKVPGVDSSGRTVAFYHVCFFMPRVSYTPLLLAEVKLNTAQRNNLKIEIGVSSTNQTTPAKIMGVCNYVIGFNYHWFEKDVSYNFTGGTTPEDGTFTFDFTPVIEEYFATNPSNISSNAPIRLYIIMSDQTNDSHSQILKTFKVIDRISEATVNATTTLPIYANNSTVMAYADYTLPTPLVEEDKEWELTFNYPIREESINDQTVTVKDKNDNSAQVSFDYSTDRKTVTVYPPAGGYRTGNYYTLELGTDLLTDGGNSFSTPQQKFFYVP